jgi:hypothetical protein
MRRFGKWVLVRDRGEAILTADQVFSTHLRARVFRNGELIADHDLGSGLVTTAGVNDMATDFGSGTNFQMYNQQDTGTGTTAAAIGDTALQTPTGGSRVAGTKSNPSAGQYRSVATITYGGSFAVTEWGLFKNASGAPMWDRRVFAAINVDTSTSIEFTYTLTINAGG